MSLRLDLQDRKNQRIAVGDSLQQFDSVYIVEPHSAEFQMQPPCCCTISSLPTWPMDSPVPYRVTRNRVDNQLKFLMKSRDEPHRRRGGDVGKISGLMV